MATSILARLGLDSSAFDRGIDSVSTKAERFSEAFGSAVRRAVQVAGVAFAGFVANSIREFSNFETAISEVFTLLPDASDQSLGRMSADVRELASTMGLDLQDAVNSLYQAISAGVDPDNAVTFLEQSAQTAIAGVASLEEAVGALTTILNGYGMEADEAGRVSDVLFSVVRNGVTTMSELGRNIGRVTPLASQLGVSIEQVGAMFATLTAQMGAGRTAETATAIRSMLAELARAGTTASDAFRDLAGVSFPEFTQKGGQVIDALQMMKTHADANGLSMTDLFSSIDAGMAGLMLMNNEGRSFVNNLANMEDASGSTAEAFDRMEQSTGRSIDRIISAFREMGLTFAENLMPVINENLPDFEQAIRDVTPFMVDLAETTIDVATAFVDWLPTILTITTGVASFGLAVKALKLKILGLGTAVGAIIPPLGALIAGLTIGTEIRRQYDDLANAVAYLTLKLFSLNDQADALEIKEVFEGLQDDIDKSIDELQDLNTELEDMQDTLENMEETQLFSDVDGDLLDDHKRKIADINDEFNGLINAQQGLLQFYNDELRELEAQENSLQNQGATKDQILIKEREIFDKLQQIRQVEIDIERLKVDQKNAINDQVNQTNNLHRAELQRQQDERNAQRDKERKEQAILAVQQQLLAVVAQTKNERFLERTEAGRILLAMRDIKQKEQEVKDLLAISKTERGLNADQADRLKNLLGDVDLKEQDIRDILQNQINVLRQDELNLIRDQITELDTKLAKEQQIVDELEQQEESKQDAIQALRDELALIDGALDPLRQFFEVDMHGNITANTAVMHREFRRLRDAGILPPDVFDFRDYREFLTDQASALYQQKLDVIEKGQIEMAGLLAIQAEREDHLENVAELEAEIADARQDMIDAEEQATERARLNLDETRQMLEQLESALRNLDDAEIYATFSDNVTRILNGQDSKLLDINEVLGGILDSLGSGLDVDLDGSNLGKEQTLRNIHDTLQGYFVNQ